MDEGMPAGHVFLCRWMIFLGKPRKGFSGKAIFEKRTILRMSQSWQNILGIG